MDMYERIDQFFAKVGASDAPAVQAFQEALGASYQLAEKALQRQIILNVLSWASFYSVASGVVAEVTFGSLKLSKLDYLVAIAPAITGFLAYTLACAAFMSLSIGTAFWRTYKHILPAAYELDLERMIGPSTFFHVERTLRSDEHRAHKLTANAVATLFIAAGTLGTLAALVHLSLLAHATGASWYVLAGTIGVGAILWLRGVLLWVRVAFY